MSVCTGGSDKATSRAGRGRGWLREERSVLAEAQVIAPRVDDVEGVLAPRALDDLAGRLAVNLIRREHIEPSSSLVECIDVFDAEELSVQVRGELEVAHLECDAEQLRFSVDPVAPDRNSSFSGIDDGLENAAAALDHRYRSEVVVVAGNQNAIDAV